MERGLRLPLVDTCMPCNLVENVDLGWKVDRGTDRWMEGWIGRWVVDDLEL